MDLRGWNLCWVAGLRMVSGTPAEAVAQARTRGGGGVCSLPPGSLELSRLVGLEIFHLTPVLCCPGFCRLLIISICESLGDTVVGN